MHLLLRLLLVNSSLFFKGTKGGKDLAAETDILVVLPNQHGSMFSANRYIVWLIHVSLFFLSLLL